MEIDKRIITFIKKHHVLTLASATINQRGEAEPYCANMFYAYVAEANAFVFTSSEQTRHVSDVRSNNFVAGSVVVESSVVGKLQGLQFQGRMIKDADHWLGQGKVKSYYLKKFPFAAVSDLNLWVLELSFMKYTDNRLGFGKKLLWEATEDALYLNVTDR